MNRALYAALVLLAGCGGGASGSLPSVPSPTRTPMQVPSPTQSPSPMQSPTPMPTMSVSVQRISADAFTNSGSQHATEVEPSVAANGMTIVAAFQSGRFFDLGSSDISFAISPDGGATWNAGTLPAMTKYDLPPGPYDSVSDPSIAYDAAHATWLISALPILFSNTAVPGVIVARSQDGVTWSVPIGVTEADERSNDKNWLTCDNHASSPFYGHCYVEWDSFAGAGAIFMSVSTDGGQTWSAPGHPTPGVNGIGGQPLVQPDGTVVVPIDDGGVLNVLAFASHDGGATWSQAITVSAIADHLIAGNLRSIPLISAAVDASGTIYVVWQDCRFRTNCTSNDLVLSTSSDGVHWTAPSRIPIDPVSSQVDHFIPGLSVDPSTSGPSAHLGLTYYSYANAGCVAATCQLYADFVASLDGGTTWGAARTLAGPMQLGWIAQTADGAMVGDYMASTFASGRPMSIFALAAPLMSGVFNEAMYAPVPGTISMLSTLRRSSMGERPVPGFRSDHGPRHVHP